MKSDTMELNRKTAMELWKRQFGKTDRATDYAGREILKAAYDDRGSAYGWNVDHILPKSRGGKTAEHNLICCHMETNSEKADKFPCFTANDIRFEIRKVQNHYEIVALAAAPVDFFDAEAAVGFWDKCCEAEEDFWEGYLTICFDALDDDVDVAFGQFVEKLFEDERIALHGIDTKPAQWSSAEHVVSELRPTGMRSSRRKLCLRIHGLNRKKDIQRVLDLCVLLNTYMEGFLRTQGLIENYSLYYEIREFSSELEALCTQYSGKDYDRGLVVSGSVKDNTDLKEKQLRSCGTSYHGADYEYNYFYMNLKKELEEI